MRQAIERKTEQYTTQANKHRKKVVFEPGDWVWVHMRKERFPTQRRTKLHPRGDGPFQVIEKINDNAYRLDLPGEYGVSATFNVSDLSPFSFDEGTCNLRTNPFEERGNDGGPLARDVHDDRDAKDPWVIQGGPITRAHYICLEAQTT